MEDEDAGSFRGNSVAEAVQSSSAEIAYSYYLQHAHKGLIRMLSSRSPASKAPRLCVVTFVPFVCRACACV